jgi:putative hydrolase of HD superfamily
MLNKNIFLHLYKSAYMQRWNDQLRPIDLYELDKQAHKMIIAYILGKTEEKLGNKVDWIQIIEGGIFEFFQRVLLTDIKPALFYKIKKDKQKYDQLNNFFINKISNDLEHIQNGLFLKKFKNYIFSISQTDDSNINKKILNASHFLSTKWEFDIIKQYNSNGYQLEQIALDIIKRQQELNELDSVKELFSNSSNQNLERFMNLCGELRYQLRWNQLYRIPKTSVLGHMLLVAMMSYFFSIEQNCCDKRIYNNYFTGLFHDLPEVLTRDIISPIKSNVDGLDEFIKDFEQEEMKKIYSLVSDEITNDLKFFTENEFSNIIFQKFQNNKKVEVAEITSDYNKDHFNPRDGIIVEFSDKLSALIEAYLTISNGIKNEELNKAIANIYSKYEKKKIYDLNVKTILDYFVV